MSPVVLPKKKVYLQVLSVNEEKHDWLGLLTTIPVLSFLGSVHVFHSHRDETQIWQRNKTLTCNRNHVTLPKNAYCTHMHTVVLSNMVTNRGYDIDIN